MRRLKDRSVSYSAPASRSGGSGHRARNEVMKTQNKDILAFCLSTDTPFVSPSTLAAHACRLGRAEAPPRPFGGGTGWRMGLEARFLTFSAGGRLPRPAGRAPAD